MGRDVYPGASIYQEALLDGLNLSEMITQEYS